MKKQWMKWLTLFILIGMTAPALAQQPEGQPEERRKREIPSPEKNARRITREFKQVFQLTDDAYEKVYELYLTQEKTLMPEQFTQGGMPQRGNMGRPGGGPGGQRGGGPGMGGRPNMGGMPPQGGFRPEMEGVSPEEIKAQIEKRQQEQAKKQEKAAKKLAKKMKKILKGEQYVQWQEWEADRQKKSQRPPLPSERPMNEERESL